jgi:hypothetical protein
MRSILAAVVLAQMLSGCAIPDWYKPEASSDETVAPIELANSKTDSEKPIAGKSRSNDRVAAAKMRKVAKQRGKWIGQLGPYQLFVNIDGSKVGGRVRASDERDFAVAGKIDDDGQVRARFLDEIERPIGELSGPVRLLNFYEGGVILGRVRMRPLKP